MTLKEIKSIHKCDCGRKYCEFFAPSLGEFGGSLSRTEIKEMIAEEANAQEKIKHLKSLLK